MSRCRLEDVGRRRKGIWGIQDVRKYHVTNIHYLYVCSCAQGNIEIIAGEEKSEKED